MPHCSFFIDDPRQTKLAYIRAKIKITHAKYIAPSLGEKIPVENWDTKKQRAKNKHRGAVSLNAFLDNFQARIENERRQLLISNELSSEKMWALVEELLGRRSIDFYSVFDAYIEERRNMVSSTTRNSLPEKYANVRDKLFRFNPNLTFADINYDFWRSWEQWLYAKDGISVNTASRAAKFLTTFLREMNKRGHTINVAHMSYSIKQQPTLHPYLTIDELNILYTYRADNEMLENVRILLLIGCYCGQRYSDWDKLTPESLVREGSTAYFSIFQQKTRNYTIIPAHAKLIELVNMRPRMISNQKFNDYVKQLCEAAGIDALFVKPVYKAKLMTQVVYKKYELVASHIGRRSFVCNSIKAGVSQEMIMRAGGWSSYESFKKYVQLSSTDGLNQYADVF